MANPTNDSTGEGEGDAGKKQQHQGGNESTPQALQKASKAAGALRPLLVLTAAGSDPTQPITVLHSATVAAKEAEAESSLSKRRAALIQQLQQLANAMMAGGGVEGAAAADVPMLAVSPSSPLAPSPLHRRPSSTLPRPPESPLIVAAKRSPSVVSALNMNQRNVSTPNTVGLGNNSSSLGAPQQQQPFSTLSPNMQTTTTTMNSGGGLLSAASPALSLASPVSPFFASSPVGRGSGNGNIALPVSSPSGAGGASSSSPLLSSSPNSNTNSSNLVTISLGQGQEQAALRAVVDAARHGRWVVLLNAHLSMNTLKPLERLLAALFALPQRDVEGEERAAYEELLATQKTMLCTNGGGMGGNEHEGGAEHADDAGANRAEAHDSSAPLFSISHSRHPSVSVSTSPVGGGRASSPEPLHPSLLIASASVLLVGGVGQPHRQSSTMATLLPSTTAHPQKDWDIAPSPAMSTIGGAGHPLNNMMASMSGSPRLRSETVPTASQPQGGTAVTRQHQQYLAARQQEAEAIANRTFDRTRVPTAAVADLLDTRKRIARVVRGLEGEGSDADEEDEILSSDEDDNGGGNDSDDSEKALYHYTIVIDAEGRRIRKRGPVDLIAASIRRRERDEAKARELNANKLNASSAAATPARSTTTTAGANGSISNTVTTNATGSRPTSATTSKDTTTKKDAITSTNSSNKRDDKKKSSMRKRRRRKSTIDGANNANEYDDDDGEDGNGGEEGLLGGVGADEDFLFDEEAFLAAPEGSEVDAAGINQLIAMQQRRELAKLSAAGQLASTTSGTASGDGGGGGMSANLLALSNQFIGRLPPAIHPNFQLWIAAASGFTGMPQGILESCEKVAFEDNSSVVAAAEEDSMVMMASSPAETHPSTSVTSVDGAGTVYSAAFGEVSDSSSPQQHTSQQGDKEKQTAQNGNSRSGKEAAAQYTYPFAPLLRSALQLFYASLTERTALYGTGDGEDAGVIIRCAAASDAVVAAAASATTTSSAASDGWGWNCGYAFSQADLSVSIQLLEETLEATLARLLRQHELSSSSSSSSSAVAGRAEVASSTMVSVASFLVGKMTFGGRVTDVRDAKLLSALFTAKVGPIIAFIVKAVWALFATDGEAAATRATVFELSAADGKAREALLRRVGASAPIGVTSSVDSVVFVRALLKQSLAAMRGRVRDSHVSSHHPTALDDDGNEAPEAATGRHVPPPLPTLLFDGLFSAIEKSLKEEEEEEEASAAILRPSIIALDPSSAQFHGLHPSADDRRRAKEGSQLAQQLSAALAVVTIADQPSSLAKPAPSSVASSTSGGARASSPLNPAASSPSSSSASTQAAAKEAVAMLTLIDSTLLPLLPKPIRRMGASEERERCQTLRVLLGFDSLAGRMMMMTESNKKRTTDTSTKENELNATPPPPSSSANNNAAAGGGRLGGRSAQHRTLKDNTASIGTTVAPSVTTAPSLHSPAPTAIIFPKAYDRTDPLTVTLQQEVAQYNSIIRLVTAHLCAARGYFAMLASSSNTSSASSMMTAAGEGSNHQHKNRNSSASSSLSSSSTSLAPSDMALLCKELSLLQVPTFWAANYKGAAAEVLAEGEGDGEGEEERPATVIPLFVDGDKKQTGDAADNGNDDGVVSTNGAITSLSTASASAAAMVRFHRSAFRSGSSSVALTTKTAPAATTVVSRSSTTSNNDELVSSSSSPSSALPASSPLVQWLKDLAQRAAFMQQWCTRHEDVFIQRLALLKSIFVSNEGGGGRSENGNPSDDVYRRINRAIEAGALERPAALPARSRRGGERKQKTRIALAPAPAFIAARHPTVFPITAFASPQGLLTAFKQTFARYFSTSVDQGVCTQSSGDQQQQHQREGTSKATVDQVSFDCRVVTIDTEAPTKPSTPSSSSSSSVFAPIICGLSAVGFCWDESSQCCELLPTVADYNGGKTDQKEGRTPQQLVSPFPPIEMKPRLLLPSSPTPPSSSPSAPSSWFEKDESAKDSSLLAIPVYKASYRAGERNYVADVRLPIHYAKKENNVREEEDAAMRWAMARAAFLATWQGE